MSNEAPTRRLRAVPADAVPETAATVLPGSPRVAALDALLREVDSLRLSLETDLDAAADAVEAGDVSLAQDLIESDLDSVRGFENRALGHLSELAAGRARAGEGRRWWSRVPVAPFVAAAALVGFLVGIVPNDLTPAPTDTVTSTVSADSRLGALTQLAASGASASQIQAASDQLHAELGRLIDAAKNDPEVARQVLAWLNAERRVLESSGDTSTIAALLRQSDALSRRVTAVARPAVAVPVAAPAPSPTKPAPTAQPNARPTTQPKPAPSASPSPSASAKPPVLPEPPNLGE